MTQVKLKNPKQKPASTGKKIFHELYPIDITDLTENEIEKAIETYCKIMNIPYKRKK
jgi:hypothetical protein